MNSPSPVPLPPTRLHLNDCVVDLASREVRTPQVRRPLRLAPKALAVLQVLAARAGQVVTREQLLAEVWPDTCPTNDVVTQAVTQLRKALGGGSGQGGKAAIETIAKTGYRLLATVAWDCEAPPVLGPVAAPVGRAGAAVSDSGGNAPASVAASSSRRLRIVIWLLIAFVCGVVVALVLRRGDQAEKVVPRSFSDEVPAPNYRLITASGKFDLSPTLSPDASMVAYASWWPDRPGASILVKTTDSAPPRVLSRPSPGEEDGEPAWSPDGREIAFVRQSPDGRCRVMIASANAATDEREVVRCADADTVSFSWSPDGAALLFGGMAAIDGDSRQTWYGIRRFDLRSGRWQALSYPSDAQHLDYAPRYSPDGKWIAFIRNPQMGDIWLLPSVGGHAEPLTHDSAELRGLAWLPDGSGLLFGRRTGNQSRLYRLDLATRQLRDLGLDDAQAPAISARNDKLVFVQRKPRFGIYRIDHDTHGRLRRQRLFASNGCDVQPMLAPNGRELVFASDRSGRYALWWGDLSAGGTAKPIEGPVPVTQQPPDWSPDSQRLLVVARERAEATSLYEVAPTLNHWVRLPVPEARPLQAVYLRDPARLLVLAASADGAAVLTLYDRSVRPWRRLQTMADVSQVHVDEQHNRVLFTRFSADGLWQADPSLMPASVRPLERDAPSRWFHRNWAVSGRGAIRYLAATATCSSSVGALATATAAVCVDPVSFSAGNGISTDRSGATLYVALAAEQGSGIAFMDLPVASASHVGAIGVPGKWLSWKRN